MGKCIKSVLLLVIVALPSSLSERAFAAYDLIFTIARSTNANVVNYVANVTSDGGFEANEPVTAFWIMNAQDGHHEPLTHYESEHLYGFDLHPTSSQKSSFTLTIKAFPKLPINVSINDGVAQAETEISGHQATLKQVYVQMNGGLIPSVNYVKLSGTDPETNSEVSEVIHPS